jgi:hypothetical protein
MEVLKMVWAVFLILYHEQVRGGFDSHIVATYDTPSECSYEAVKLSSERRNVYQSGQYVYMVPRAEYLCAPIPKQ